MIPKKINYIAAFAACVLAGLLGACEDNVNKEVNFDRTELLENVGENIILPKYESFFSDVASLKTAIDDFVAEPSEDALAAAEEVFAQAYASWQSVSFYEFGPAADQLLRTSLNSYPADKLQIENNIESGEYDLSLISNFDAKGFPAIDYLLFHAQPAEIVGQFTASETAEERKSYLQDVAGDMHTRTQTTLNEWSPEGGDYLSVFVSLSGTDVGSSLGMMVNALNLHFEKNTRDAKIGIPLGVRSQGEPIPNRVEAYYSQQSIELAAANVEAIHNFYLGKNGADGPGIHDYLVALDAKFNDESLAEVIDKQFVTAKSAVEAIPEPYSETVETNPDPADAAYTELQKLVVLLKVDMPSALGVLITYQDNDGD